MHKSYCIQDGCHNCGECGKIYAGLFCVLGQHEPHEDPSEIAALLVTVQDDAVQVQPAGKCNEWRAKK